MKLFKISVLAILSLVLFVLIGAAFVDGHYEVSESILINRSSPVVFAYVSHIKNQETYNVWLQKDTNSLKTYTGTDGVAGFTAAWKSNIKKAVQGEQEIKKVIPNKRIDIELRLIRPFVAPDHMYIETIAQDEEETKVIWGLTGEMNYPINMFLLFVRMDKVLGEDMNRSLMHLKRILESR